jgi:hypothetical protein
VATNADRSSFGPTVTGTPQGAGAGIIPAMPSGGKTGGKNVKKQVEDIKKVLKREGTIATKEARLISAGISEGLADKIIGTSTPIKSANKVLAKIKKNGADAVANIQKKFNKTKAGQAEIAAISAQNEAQAELSRQQAEAAARDYESAQQEIFDAEQDRLNQQARVYQSFLDSVSNTFSRIKDSILGAFSLPELGSSTASIIRNMNKLISATRSFASNISQLSTMGLSPELLQQVIAAGPMAGGRLAAALVAGGAGAISEINTGFGEFSGLAGNIATTGTNSLFNRASQQNIYNIEVSGGVGSGASIGQAIVEAIKAYERTSGAVWQGA